MKTYNQMINLFEERMVELVKKLEADKLVYSTNVFPIWSARQKEQIVSLYNLNLRLLKIWVPGDRRLPMGKRVH